MRAAEFIESLQARGFVVKRKTDQGSAVWLQRGDQELMVDTRNEVPDEFAARVLKEADAIG